MITIPAFKETSIVDILFSLDQCVEPEIDWEVYVLINSSSLADEHTQQVNHQSLLDVQSYLDSRYKDNMFVDHVTFPPKHAGVGLARKTLMDRAAEQFDLAEEDGIIAALDADCHVSTNYLVELCRFFQDCTFEAASLYFEHPIDDPIVDYAIIDYEYHLRYFIVQQQRIGLPFAIHTVGSSMACRASSYLAKGRMNKRKAGEDFYFMHKFIKDQVCGALNELCVYPSGRISDRVPFGTGRAVGKTIQENTKLTSYNPEAFDELLPIVNGLEQYYLTDKIDLSSMHELSLEYFDSIDLQKQLAAIKKHVSSFEAFTKRFYQFFDAFKLMKYLHHVRPVFPDILVEDAAKYMQATIFKQNYVSTYDSLIQLRAYERNAYKLATD